MNLVFAPSSRNSKLESWPRFLASWRSEVQQTQELCLLYEITNVTQDHITSDAALLKAKFRCLQYFVIWTQRGVRRRPKGNNANFDRLLLRQAMSHLPCASALDHPETRQEEWISVRFFDDFKSYPRAAQRILMLQTPATEDQLTPIYSTFLMTG